MPSSVWCLSPRSSAVTSSAIALGWSPRGSYSDTILNGRSPIAGEFSSWALARRAEQAVQDIDVTRAAHVAVVEIGAGVVALPARAVRAGGGVPREAAVRGARDRRGRHARAELRRPAEHA